MKKISIITAAIVLSSCATVAPVSQQINNVKPITFIFPKDDCDQLYFDYKKDVLVQPTYEQKFDAKINNDSIDAGILRGKYNQKNMTFSSSIYNIPIKKEYNNDSCKVITLAPYTLTQTYSDPSAQLIAPAASISSDEITSWLKVNAKADVVFTVQSKYSPRATFNSLNASMNKYASNIDLEKFVGQAKVSYNGDWYTYDITVKPNKEGSMATISLWGIGKVSDNTIDFRQSTGSMEAVLTKRIQEGQ